VYQKLSRRYQDLKDQKYQFICTDSEKRQVKLFEAKVRCEKITDVLVSTQKEFPIQFLDKLVSFTQDTTRNATQI
jgi:hypothetical protein